MSDRADAEESVREAAEAADGIEYPVLEVSMARDDQFKLDPYRFKVECSGVDLRDLHDGWWLTVYHDFQVVSVRAEDQATGVVAVIRRRAE